MTLRTSARRLRIVPTIEATMPANPTKAGRGHRTSGPLKALIWHVLPFDTCLSLA